MYTESQPTGSETSQTTATPQPIQKTFLTSQEAANYLGIALITIRTYCCKRIIPYYKTRRKVYFKLEDLDNYVLNNANRILSNEEIQRQATRYDASR